MSDEPAWKAIALWLADVQAATTAHDCSLKSVSRGRKGRLRRICAEAARMIRGAPADRRPRSIDEVLRRLDANSEVRGDG